LSKMPVPSIPTHQVPLDTTALYLDLLKRCLPRSAFPERYWPLLNMDARKWRFARLVAEASEPRRASRRTLRHAIISTCFGMPSTLDQDYAHARTVACWAKGGGRPYADTPHEAVLATPPWPVPNGVPSCGLAMTV